MRHETLCPAGLCACISTCLTRFYTPACSVTHVCGKPSIGLGEYSWLVEANSDVAASCYTANKSDPWRCPTTFVGPMNMGASFNKTSWRLKGDVIGTEFRALNNLGWVRSGDQLGLTGWGPNINLARECVSRPLPLFTSFAHVYTC